MTDTPSPPRFKLAGDPDVLAEIDAELAKTPSYSVRIDPESETISLRKLDFQATEDRTARRVIHPPALKTMPSDGPQSPGNRYETSTILGEGSTAQVFNAIDRDLKREVAIKVLNVQTDESRAAFLEEAKIAARLTHPNIAAVHTIDVDEEGRAFLSMQKVEGQRLAAYCSPDGKSLTAAELTLTFLKLCDALSYAHSKDVIHQDLKPDNVIVGEFGQVHLFDWGAVSAAPGERQLSPAYMSPQQAQGLPPTPMDDVYGLGTALYHILTKRLPTSAATITELWEKKCAGVIDPLPAHARRSVPESLLAIALKATAKKPSDRYPSIAAFSADLLAFREGFVTSAETASQWKQFRLLIARNQFATVTIATALLLVAISLGAAASFNYRERVATAATLGQLQQSEAQRTQAEALRQAEERKQKSASETRAKTVRRSVMLLRSKAHEAVEALRFEDAHRLLSESLSLQPTNTELYLLRGLVALRLKRVANARTDLEYYAARSPETHDLLQNVDEFSKEYISPRTRRIYEHTTRLAGVPSLSINIVQPDQLLKTFRAKMEMSSPGSGNALTTSRKGLALTINNASGITTLETMRDFPITRLKIDNVAMDNLDAVATWPLREAAFINAPIADLSALSTCKELATLEISGAKATQLPNLENTSISELNIRSSKFKNWSILSNLKLQNLTISYSHVKDVSFLRKMPLQYLKLYANPISDLTPLSGKNIDYVNLGATGVRDLSPLSTCTFSELHIMRTKVEDLTPLQGMALKRLDLASTQVKDLEPLRGSSLIWLNLAHCKVSDLSPIVDCPLVKVYCTGLKIQDFSDLEKIHTLKSVWFPDGSRKDF